MHRRRVLWRIFGGATGMCNILRHRAELRISLPSFLGIFRLRNETAIFLTRLESPPLSCRPFLAGAGRFRKARSKTFRQAFVTECTSRKLFRNLEFDYVDMQGQQTPQQSAKCLIAQTFVNTFASWHPQRLFSRINLQIVCAISISPVYFAN